MNIFDYLLINIESDDESGEDVSNRLLGLYDTASETERKIIDKVFIALCGYSFVSLKEKVAHY